jgi:hypothetical protein
MSNETTGAALVPAQTEEVSGLVRLALEKGHPVEVLERLVALQERVTDRDARMAYIQALSRFREECPQPQKNRENSQFQVTRNGTKKTARYSSLDEIERVTRPVAARHGLTWTWDTRMDGELMHVSCKVRHIDGHEDSATVSLPVESKAGASPQQKFAITQTYGMRYSLIAALGITSTDDDTDGNAPPAETITASQEADLRALIEDVGADEARFRRYLGVKALGDLAASDLPGAIKALEAKRGKAQKGGDE